MENNYIIKRYFQNIFSLKQKVQSHFLTSTRYLSAVLLMVMAPALNAQVNSSFTFDSDLQGWATEGFGTFNQSITQACGNGSSARANVFYDGINNFISPSLGTATAGLVTVNFDYKVVEYAALDAALPSKVLILAQWSNSADGPWTTFQSVNNANHIASANCATKTGTFTPTPGPLFIKFQSKAVGVTSDLFYYYDNIVVSQAADGPCAAVGVPYTMPLDASVVPALPECVTIENINGDDKVWGTLTNTTGITGKVMRYAYSIPNAANDWFYTRKLNLVAGSSYRLSFKYKITGFEEKLKVAIGSSATASAMTQVLTDLTIASSVSGGQLKVIDFTVPTTGVYNVGFQAHSAANANEMYVGEISLIASPTCLPALNPMVTVGSVTQTGFTFSWTASTSAPALGYDYEVRSSGAAGSGATGLAASGSVAAGVTTAIVTGLTNSSVYSVYVKAKCTASDSSSWTAALSIATVCGVSNVPYTLPLASAVVPALPNCVTIENLNNDNKFWKTTTSASGIVGQAMEYAYSSSLPADDWFYTNSLNLTAGTNYRLSFKYAITGYEEKLKVAVGSSATVTAMTQTLIDLTIPSSVNTAQLQIIDFTVSTTGSYNIGFQAHSIAFQNSLFVGEVSLDLTPSCIAPANIIVDVASVTQTGYSFSWTASSSLPAEGYEYEVRSSGAAGSGATGLASSGSTSAGITTASVSGLSASTTYTTYVRAKCSSADSSVWTAANTVNTICAVANIPYVMPLDSAVVPALPICVTIENVNNDTSVWKTVATTEGITGQVMQYNYNFSMAADDWFFSAPLNLTAGVNYRVSFKYRVTNYEEKLKVAVGSTATATAMTQTLLDLTIPSNTLGGILQTVDFIVASTGVQYVGFQAHSDSNKNNLYVGEISVTVGPTCLAPTGVISTNLDKNSVTIAWEAASTIPANGYSYEIRTSGAAGSGAIGLAASGNTAAGILTANVVGLTPSTEYSIYVSSNCATDDLSLWTTAVKFTTLCDYLEIVAVNDTTCVGSTATLQVTGATTEVSWFATDTSLEVLEEGPVYETPVLLQTTSYWAQVASPSEGLAVQVGSGASVAESYQNPFYSLWSNNHTQHIILASELTAAGLLAGPINSVALTVTNNGSLPMLDLTVKIGTTTAVNMADFVDNSAFSIVYTSASLMPTIGLNTLPFNTPFMWDGTSNIVLEFCHGNASSTASMFRTVLADATLYPSSVKSHSTSSTSGAASCGMTTIAKESFSLRPVFTFVGSSLCIAPSRTEVIATVNQVPVITGNNVQTVTVATMEDATLANLEPSGAGINWFPTEADAIAFTNELEIGTQLNSGTTYYAVLTENDCRSLPFAVLVTVELGLINQTMTNLTYYPNPVQDKLNIEYSENITSVVLFNLVGQKVMTITPNATKVVLDMSRLPAGTYMIQVNADTASKVIKLIKK